MHIQDALGRFLVQLEANGRSTHTRKQYRRHVTAFADWLAPRTEVAAVTHEDIAGFLASPTARQRPDGGLKRASSMNAVRTSLKVFFGYLHEAGVIAENPARLVRRAVCGPPLPQALSEAEQRRLVAVLADAPERDRLLFTLMLRCGLRVGSAVALDVDDVDLARQELRLRSAKGDREERVPIPGAVVASLARFLDARAGPLFPARGGGRLSVRHVQRLFSGYATAADLRTTRTHTLRHTFATRLLERTGNVLLVQRALRHRSVASTMVYAAVEDGQVRAAMEG